MDARVAKDKVTDFLAALGVAYVEVLGYEEWERLLEDGMKVAPFDGDFGILWDEQTICGWMGRSHWAGIIHEGGHLLATDKSLYAVDETDFLGWEIAVVRHLGLPMDDFIRANADYGIQWPQDEDYYDTIGVLPPDQVGPMCDFYVQVAKDLNTVNADGTPVAHPSRVFPALAGRF